MWFYKHAWRKAVVVVCASRQSKALWRKAPPATLAEMRCTDTCYAFDRQRILNHDDRMRFRSDPTDPSHDSLNFTSQVPASASGKGLIQSDNLHNVT